MTLDEQIADFVAKNQGQASGFGWDWSSDLPPAETYEDWNDNLTYDMQQRSDPMNMGRLPWFLLNPWEAQLPPEYAAAYGNSYAGVVAAQKDAYAQSGNTLPPPEAWSVNPGAPPAYQQISIPYGGGAAGGGGVAQYKVNPDGSYELIGNNLYQRGGVQRNTNAPFSPGDKQFTPEPGTDFHPEPGNYPYNNNGAPNTPTSVPAMPLPGSVKGKLNTQSSGTRLRPPVPAKRTPRPAQNTSRAPVKPGKARTRSAPKVMGGAGQGPGSSGFQVPFKRR